MSEDITGQDTGQDWGYDVQDPEISMRRHIRMALAMLGVLGVMALVGLVLIPIGGAVVASGQVGVESRVKRIAHPTGGIVAAILVANGDHVREGQDLVRLDNVVSAGCREAGSGSNSVPARIAAVKGSGRAIRHGQ
jgi:hypothetical protein